MIIIFPFLLLPSRQCPVMQFQELDQLWSWHCQRAQPTQHYSSPISTRPSPSTALFSLQPLILPQGRKTVFQTPGLLTSISETVRCSLREPRPVPGFQYKPVLLADLRYLRSFIQPPLCDSSLTSWAPFYITAGRAQAASEGSCPPRRIQDHPSSCQVDGRPPRPVWSGPTRPWWSWTMTQRTHMSLR